MKNNLKKIIIGLIFIQTITVSNSYAKTIQNPEQLRQDDSSIVMVDADWCSTCKAQRKIISSLLAQSKYKNIVLYKINFDKQKQVLKNFNVSMQSTIIAYKKGRETDRITGETRQDALEKILDKAL